MDYGASSQVSPVVFIIQLIVGIAFYVAFCYPLMKIANKKGLTGWFAWVPVLNTILMIQIAEKPIWWVILFFIPCVNIVVMILVLIEFLKAINKSPMWIFALLFSPLFLIPLWQAANEG